MKYAITFFCLEVREKDFPTVEMDRVPNVGEIVSFVLSAAQPEHGEHKTNIYDYSVDQIYTCVDLTVQDSAKFPAITYRAKLVLRKRP